MKNVSQPGALVGSLWRLLVLVCVFAGTPLLQAELLSSVSGGKVTITGFTGEETTLVIPAKIGGLPVTSIRDSAFYGCSGLTSVIIPVGVTSIGDSAFENCSGLTSVIIPTGVRSVGDNAFEGCSGLKSVRLPSSVKSIGYNAFVDCSALTSFTVESGNSVYSSLEGVLLNKARTEIILYPGGKKGAYAIPVGITSIGGNAFRACSGLTSVNLPFSLKKIDYCAFRRCNGLTSVNIPDSVTTIGNSAFDYCKELKSVNFGRGVTSIGYGAFQGCTALTNITIPGSVTSLGDNLFWGCSALSSVSIPSSVKSIGDAAFEDCRALTSITVEPQNTEFASLDGVLLNKAKTKVIVFPVGKKGSYSIPSSVKSLGEVAFEACSALTSIIVESQNTEFSSIDGVLLNKAKTSLIAFPRAKKGAYTIPGSVTSLGASAFRGCSGLTSVSIPRGMIMTGLSDDAFDGCTALVSITVEPQNKMYLSLDGVLFDKAKTSILAFPAAKQGAYTIPGSVRSIGPKVFRGCSALTSISVESQNTAYSSVEGVLLDKIKATVIAFPAGKKGAVVFPSSVTSIGDDAFQGCVWLSSVSIPNSVKSIGRGAFTNCVNLASLPLPSALTSIGDGAFKGCSSLSRLTIPNGVSEFGHNPFDGCTKLVSLVFNGNAPRLSSYDGFGGVSPNYKTYYYSDKTGFTSPLWEGYPSVCLPAGTRFSF